MAVRTQSTYAENGEAVVPFVCDAAAGRKRMHSCWRCATVSLKAIVRAKWRREDLYD